MRLPKCRVRRRRPSRSMHNLGDTVAMAGGLYELDRIKEEWNGTYGWAFQMYFLC